MEIFRRDKKKKTHNPEISPEYLNVLKGLSYSEDFVLPREARKLARVYEHDMAGGTFQVRKTLGGRTKNFPVVAVFSEFPYEAQVFEAVSENYGGGGYGVYLEGLPGVIKTFQFSGPSRYLLNGRSEKTFRQEQRDDLARQAANYARQEIDSGSVLGGQLKLELIGKALGIDVPKSAPEPTYDERLIAEYLEDHPEAQAAYTEAKLRKRGVKLPKTQTDVERMIDQITLFADLQRATKKFEDAGKPEPNLMRELVQGLVAAVPEVLSMLIELKAIPAEISAEPEVTIPKPEADGKSQAVREQTSLESNPEPEPTPFQPPKMAAGVSRRSRRAKGSRIEQSQMNQMKEFASTVDWSDLERGIHGDPVEYVEHLLEMGHDKSDGRDALLWGLKDPDTFLAALGEAVELLRGQPGLGHDYEIAVLVQKHLTESELGKQWLKTACANRRVPQ